MSTPATGPLRLILHSPAGQYALIGCGLYSLFPNEVKSFVGPLLIGNPELSISNLIGGFNGSEKQQKQNSEPQQIIIQTPAPTVINENNSKGSSILGFGMIGKSVRGTIFGIVAYAVVGAGVCWVGYAVCTKYLPDAVSEMLPVSKQFFDKTTKVLGKGILDVKKVLEEKILGLDKKQDELMRKQNITNKTVDEIHKEMGEARNDLLSMKDALDQCQKSLDDTKDMQGYTLRGVKLLVRCVTSLLPDDGNHFDELSKFVSDNDNVEEDNTGTANNNNLSFSTPSTKSRNSFTTPIFGTPIAHAVPGIPSVNIPSENVSVATPNGGGVIKDIRAFLGEKM